MRNEGKIMHTKKYEEVGKRSRSRWRFFSAYHMEREFTT